MAPYWMNNPEAVGSANSFTLFAYLNVSRISSQDAIPGEFVAVMYISESSPMNKSAKTQVSLLAWKGVGGLFLPEALMHSFSAVGFLLISAPSSLVCLSALEGPAPLSFPGKLMRDNLPCSFPFPLRII